MIKSWTCSWHRHWIVWQETVSIKCFRETGFAWSKGLLFFIRAVWKMFYSVLFAYTFLLPTISPFLLFRIVHRGNLYLIGLRRIFFLLLRLFKFEDFFFISLKNRSLGSKIHWRFIIIFIHFRYIERNDLCRRTSIILNEWCFIKSILSLGDLFLCCIIFLRLHLKHVLFESHSFFEWDFGVGFKIIVHFLC